MALGTPLRVRTERREKRPEPAMALIPTGLLNGVVWSSLHVITQTAILEAQSCGRVFYCLTIMVSSLSEVRLRKMGASHSARI